jgi:transposase
VSNSHAVENVETLSPLGKSDHIPILVTFKTKNNTAYLKTEKELWSKFSKDHIAQHGESINWVFSSEELSSNEMWGELTSKLSQISTKVPKIKIKCSENGEIISKPPWDCSSLKKRRSQKDASWRNFDINPTSVNLNIALQKNKEYEQHEAKKILQHENKIVNCMKTNPKVFYRYMHSKRKIKEAVSNLKDENNKFTESAKDTANLLASFFSSTFVKEPYGPLYKDFYKNCENVISDLSISVADVKKLLLKVNPSKSPGPDNINPKLLLSLGENEQFVHAVTLLFRKCFESGSIPSQWKTANVVALHKKGSKTLASNYRPISLTCILCKLYEQLIRVHIMNHVRSAITEKQHGFLAGRSCLSNLLEALDLIFDMIASGECVDIFYLDFQKAFDTVPHFRLFVKLSSFGIHGKTLNVVRDFLSDRIFSVSVGDSMSEQFNVSSGVPQGSVLGPILFLLYINDLPDSIKNAVLLFADDLKMIAKSSTKEINQQDINNLVLWQEKWLLKFNTKDNKCKIIHAGKNNPCNQYYMGDVLLPIVETEKDLGVTISKNLDFTDYINSCINKANSLIAWVTRTFISREKEVMLKVYKSMIRPHMEYCVQLWSPLPAHGNWRLILAIEDVQRKFTRLIDNIGLLPYKTRLEKLGLTTLLERRARGDLIETFKIVNKLSNYGENLFKFSRSGDKLLSRPGDEHRAKHSFFARRVINYWNKLPCNVKFSKSIDNFKNNLQKFKSANFNQNGHHWELSNEIFNRISESNRENYVSFVSNNPLFAKRRNINTRVTMVQ